MRGDRHAGARPFAGEGDRRRSARPARPGMGVRGVGVGVHGVGAVRRHVGVGGQPSRGRSAGRDSGHDGHQRCAHPYRPHAHLEPIRGRLSDSCAGGPGKSDALLDFAGEPGSATRRAARHRGLDARARPRITTHLADLGADVIKVEPPQGDYVPPDDVADRRGRLADAPAHQPGQAQRRARPAHRRGRRGVPRPRRATPTPSSRRCAPAGSTGAASASSELREVNPRIVFCTISGYGMTGPYKRHAEPRHRVRHVGRHRARPRSTTTGFAYMPEHVVDRHQRRPAVRRARHPRRRHPGPRDRRGLPARDRAVRRGRRDRLAAQRDVARPTSGPSPRSPATRPTTTSAARPGTAGMRERRPLPVLRDAPTATCCSWRREREFWKNFCEGVGRTDLFERWPGSQYADHARGNRELQAELRDDLHDEDRAPSGSTFGDEVQHADRAGEHAEDDRRRPAVPGPAAVDPGVEQLGADQLPFPIKFVGEELPLPDARRRPSASTPTRCCATCSATTTRASPSCATSGALG